MKILDNYRRSGGLWGDVVALPTGGYAWFYSIHGAMVCESTDAAVWVQSVPTDFLRFIRAAAVVPSRFALGQALDNTCFHVTDQAAIPNGTAFGQNPVACGLAGESYVMRNPREYTKNGVPVAIPLTSQGIRDVLPDGTVVMGDPTYHATIGGHPFWQFQQRGNITVGQAGGDVGIGVLHGTDYLIIPRLGEPLGVHCALLTDGTLAVCAWTQQYGAELWLIDLHAASEPEPVPQPKPDPAPEPKPDPKPEPKNMEMPANVHAILAAVAVKFKAMHQGEQPARREATKRGIATVRARIPNSERWVWKTDHPTMGESGASKDAVGFVASGPIELMRRAEFIVWDTINGSTREMFPAPLNGHLVTAHMIPVEPVDWLAGDQQPKPNPPDEPAPKPKLPENVPTLHDWIHGEYPQLVEAYKSRHGSTPGHEWASFQTYRRYVEGWSLARMLEHERTS